MGTRHFKVDRGGVYAVLDDVWDFLCRLERKMRRNNVYM